MSDSQKHPIFIVLLLSLGLWSNDSQAARCFWVSSYAPGYEWNDGIEAGIRETLAGKCELKLFYMDTKRHPSAEFGRQQARKAHQQIKAYQPDVIIASDDNASRYLIRPYYRNVKTPVVFCGLNWSVKEYGYPYKNATGMVEFAPIAPLLKEVNYVLGHPKRAIYLSSDVKTERKEYQYYKKIFATQKIQLDAHFAQTLASWKQGFLAAQEYDFIFIGNNGGINDWDNKHATDFALQQSKKLSITNNLWMSPYSMMAFVKIPREQGEWAATVALEIISGVKPNEIPITPNRKWNVYINPTLLKKANISLRQEMQHKAIKVIH